MKPIRKLILLEVLFLKRTIIIMGLILTAFVAALLSVISVLLDVPLGMYAGLDEYLPHFTITVDGVSEAFEETCNATAVCGTLDGMTRYAVLEGKNAVRTHPPKNEAEGEGEALAGLTFSGYYIPAANAARLEEYAAAFTKSSRLPAEPGEIAMSSTIATLLGVKIGDKITVRPDTSYRSETDKEYRVPEHEPEEYTVVGLYAVSTITGIIAKTTAADIPAAYYYMTENGHTMTTMRFDYPDARTMHTEYLKLQRAGYTVTSISAGRQLDNIGLAQAFFGAISLVLGAMVFFILYSLIAIFYRQRRKQICRLKLLGAQTGTIARIYCSIAIVLTVVAVILGAAFSMAFNLYFMKLCGSLFKKFSSNFVSHFRPSVPLTLFAVLASFTLLLFFVINRRIRNETIAQEVRSE